MKKIAVLIFIFSVALSLNAYSTTPMEHDAMVGMLPRISKPADYTITVDRTVSDPIKNYHIKDLTQYESKVVLVIFKDNEDMLIDVDKTKYRNIIKNGSKQNDFSSVGGKRSAITRFRFELLPSIAGNRKIVFSSKVSNDEFILHLSVAAKNIREMIRNIGLESLVKKSPDIKVVIEKYGLPKYSSQLFFNNVRYVVYHFAEYGIGYQLLCKDGVISEMKQFFGNWDSGVNSR